MSKELKSLERIENYQVVVDYEKDETSTIKQLLPNSCKTLETALENCDSLLEKYNFKDIKELDDFLNKHRFIHQEQLNNEKKLKALEIIKEKKVDIKDLYKVLSFYLLHPDCELKEYIYYNSLKTAKERLTEEKYNLLKEVLL